MYGSKLFATYNKDKGDTGLLWYCPRKMDDELFWVKPSLAIPPMINCLIQLLEMHIDPITKKIVSRNNTTISTHDFGGDTSVDYVDAGIFGFHFIETFDTFFSYLKGRGYTVHKDLFAAPYDWRCGVIGLDDFWPNYKSLIENATTFNNRKVTIFAYSTGGYLTQLFLSTSPLIDDQWKRKYIASVIYLAPSFGGITISFASLFRHYNPVLPFIRNTYMTNMLVGLPILYNHFPNHIVFNGTKIIFGPDGDSYGPPEMPQLLIDHKKLSGDGFEFLRRSIEISKKAPRPSGLPTIILYNSKSPTFFYLNFSKGWEQPPIVSYEPGDGTIPAKGPEWACKNWNNWNDEYFYPGEKKNISQPIVHCINMNSTKVEFQHVPMASNKYIHQLAYNFTNYQEWTEFKEDKPEEEWKNIYQRTWI